MWQRCKKNPGHEEFISIPEFIDRYVARVQPVEQRHLLQSMADLTVRLRVRWTSLGRSEQDPVSHLRGSNATRCGTGFIDFVVDPVTSRPCPCNHCHGQIARKFWRFRVRTAQHVVYDTDEAKKTMVDLFNNGEHSREDGEMKTMTGLGLMESDSDCDRNLLKDFCNILCVTHDEVLGERIKSAWRCYVFGNGYPLNLCDLGLLPHSDQARFTVLVVSHPHGQPKKVTVGEVINEDYPLIKYTAATCPGSSGAPVMILNVGGSHHLRWSPPVHCGSFTTSSQQQHPLTLLERLSRLIFGHHAENCQINYCNRWY